MLSQYQDLVLPSLRRLVEHQHQGDAGERYEARFLHSVVDQLRGRGVDLPAGKGPWTVGARWLRGPGRGGLPVIPLVQRGDTVVMTDTWDEARRLAGLLNWCRAPSLLSRSPVHRGHSRGCRPERVACRLHGLTRLPAKVPEAPT